MTISNQHKELDAPKTRSSSRRAVISILIGCAIMFGILQLGVTWLADLLDATWAALIVTAIMLVVAVVLEKLFFNRNTAQGFAALGFGLPIGRALLVPPGFNIYLPYSNYFLYPGSRNA